MQSVQAPVISLVADIAAGYPDTIFLTQGIVSYGPPQQALDQLGCFLSDPLNHRYQPGQGLPALRNAIAAKLKAENGIEIANGNSLFVTAGANMAFIYALLAIADPGDELILLLPYYFNHEMAVKMADCNVVLVPTDDRYQPVPDAIRGAIGERTRAVVTISPNNPTGAVYEERLLREVNEICRSHGIYHINDEAYEYFTYNDAKHFSPGSIAESANHTVSIYSLSKSYGFAGWRIGYMVMPDHLLSAVAKIQDTIMICPPVISQHVAVGAMQVGSAYCRSQLNRLKAARATAIEALEELADLCTVPSTEGAFYFFLKVHSNMDSLELVEHLIREYRVAVLPGIAFGATDGCYLRVSYGALNKETVASGIGRLIRGLKEIVRR